MKCAVAQEAGSTFIWTHFIKQRFPHPVAADASCFVRDVLTAARRSSEVPKQENRRRKEKKKGLWMDFFFFFFKCCVRGQSGRSSLRWCIKEERVLRLGPLPDERRTSNAFCPEVTGNFQREYKEKRRAEDEEVEMRRDCSLVPAGTLQTNS